MAIYHFVNKPHGYKSNNKNKAKINTMDKYDYISREGKYEHYRGQEDLLFKSFGNMPKWADSPRKFWQAAELHRCKNGRAYREFEFGLQKELSLNENIELIEEFIDVSGIKYNHAYSYGIHNPIATFDKANNNIHCHLIFNEKIIEKNRPLDAENYFKRYSINRKGEVCGGYKKNRYWHDEKCLLELRKKWADIVNKKFKEKGLDISISEATLEEQKAKAISEGKTDDLMYFDRPKPVHLGPKFKNPQDVAYMHEKEREFEEKITNDEDVATDEADEEIESVKKLKLQMVAMDNVMRKLARKMQKERIKIRKEMDRNQQLRESERVNEDPMILTVNDMIDYLNDNREKFVEAVNKQIKQYEALRKQIIPKEIMEKVAKNNLSNGEFDRANKSYAYYTKKVEEIEKKEPKNREELLEFTNQSGRAIRASEEAADVINKWAKYFNEHPDEIQAEIEKLKSKNNVDLLQAKREYAQIKSFENKLNKYDNLLNKLKQFNPGDILISEEIPPATNLRSKIYGKVPLYKLKSFTKDNATYFFIEDDQNKEKTAYKAVKLGESIIKGNTMVYEISFDQKNKSIITKTEETIPLYARNNYRKAIAYADEYTKNEKKYTDDLVKQTAYTRSCNIARKLKAVVDKILDDGQPVRLNVHWNQDEYEEAPKNEQERIEKELEYDWSL